MMLMAAASPMPLMAESPKRTSPFLLAENFCSDSFTSGPRQGMFIAWHSDMSFVILVMSLRHRLILPAMNSAG